MAQRRGFALYSLPALDGLLEGEAEATKFDTACNLLSAQRSGNKTADSLNLPHFAER